MQNIKSILYEILVLIKILTINICKFQIVTNPTKYVYIFQRQQQFKKYNLNSLYLFLTLLG